MNERVQAENQAFREMFQTEGWKLLVRNTEERMKMFRDGFPANTNTEQELWFVKGLMAALDEILRLPAILEQIEEALAQPEVRDADT